MADRQAALARCDVGGVVDEGSHGRLAVSVQVCGGGVVHALIQGDAHRAQDGVGIVLGVGRSDGDFIVAYRKLQRSGEVPGHEVVEGQVTVHIDVDREVGDGVQNGEVCGRVFMLVCVGRCGSSDNCQTESGSGGEGQ